jgi:uncharacterized protein Yka (UPF0111/DUF47 family)
VKLRDAKGDILRLHEEVKNLGKVASDIQHLFTGPNNAELLSSQKLLDAINDCSTQLKTLEKTLDPGMKRKGMSRFGIRALKWPSQGKQVDKVIKDLERRRDTIHPETRIDLFRQIKEWEDDPQGKCMFWLNGMAGVGI